VSAEPDGLNRDLLASISRQQYHRQCLGMRLDIPKPLKSVLPGKTQIVFEQQQIIAMPIKVWARSASCWIVDLYLCARPSTADAIVDKLADVACSINDQDSL